MTVLSFYTENLVDVGGMNAPLWKRYCDKHGYLWKGLTPTMASFKHSVFWEKFYFIIDELENSTNNLIWVDVDIVVRNDEYPLENILALSNRDILISSDPWGLCTGFMVVRNTPWSKRFFKTLAYLENLDADIEYKVLNCRGQREQGAVKYLYTGFPSVNSRIFLLSEDVVSCPVTTAPSAPFHHYWNNSGGKYKKQLLEDLEAMTSGQCSL